MAKEKNNSLNTNRLRLQPRHQSRLARLPAHPALLGATKGREHVWVVESVDADVAAFQLG